MMRPRIMYIEQKSSEDIGGPDGGPARIGRVTFSKTGKTVYYGGLTFQRRNGVYGNHFEVETGCEFWITGPKRNAGNRNYSNAPIKIDEDVREEYWTTIRGLPQEKHKTSTRF